MLYTVSWGEDQLTDLLCCAATSPISSAPAGPNPEAGGSIGVEATVDDGLSFERSPDILVNRQYDWSKQGALQ